MASTSPTTRGVTKKGRPSRGKDLTKAACFTCRRKKVRCSGTSPCTYCSKRGLDCALPELGQRRAYSILEIQQLRERLAQYENTNTSCTDSDAVDVRTPPINHTPPFTVREHNSRSHVSTPPGAADEATRLPPGPGPGGFDVPSTRASNSLDHRDIHRDSYLTSSHTFGSQVQSLLETSNSRQINDHSNAVNSPLILPDMQEIPAEDEACRLLEIVIFYIGETQHHFDVREFADRLGAFYANSHDPAQQQTPWFLEMLLVLAIGQLFSGRTDDQNEIPGSKLFYYAYRSLPALGELYTHGVLGVEILALVAVYLQNLNRKDEAYLHISTALRLAVSLGFHRRSGSQNLLQSQQVHINRLWWTVYMQERRLAAATGNPFSINEDAIELALPGDCIGYSTSGLLKTNLKISRVLSKILTVIYGPRRLAEDAFIPNVREIVKSIFEIAQEIPPEKFASYPGLSLDSSIRASAYLHLMLYQALILTTRPVMLHVAKQILNGEIRNIAALDASPLGRFSRSCSEAARRLLDVISGLRERNMLIIFGFFDFDAVFSAAFVMILSAIIDSFGATNGPNWHNPPPGLQVALETLQYLAKRGNYFAQRGYEDATQTWLHFTAYQQRQSQEADIESSGRVVFTPSTSNPPDMLYTPVAPQIMNPSTENLAEMPTRATPNSAGYKTFGSTTGGISQAPILDMDLLSTLADLWGETVGPASGDMLTGVDGCTPAPTTDELHHYLYPMYSNLDSGLNGDDVEHFAKFRKSVLNL